MSRSWRGRPRSPVSRAFLLMGDDWGMGGMGMRKTWFLVGSKFRELERADLLSKVMNMSLTHWPMRRYGGHVSKVDINIIQHVLFESEGLI